MHKDWTFTATARQIEVALEVARGESPLSRIACQRGGFRQHLPTCALLAASAFKPGQQVQHWAI